MNTRIAIFIGPQIITVFIFDQKNIWFVWLYKCARLCTFDSTWSTYLQYFTWLMATVKQPRRWLRPFFFFKYIFYKKSYLHVFSLFLCVFFFFLRCHANRICKLDIEILVRKPKWLYFVPWCKFFRKHAQPERFAVLPHRIARSTIINVSCTTYEQFVLVSSPLWLL